MNEYIAYVRKRVLFLVLGTFLLFFVVLVSTGTGSVHLTITQIVNSLFHRGEGLASRILWDIRLVRILAGVLVGLSLSVAGTVMQCTLENPLASPFTMGISQGAAFGAAFSIVVLKTGEMHNSAADAVIISSPYKTTIFAFAGALIGVLVVITLARMKGLSPQALILAGIAMSFLFIAGLTLLQYVASDQELAAIIFWTFGDLGRITWRELGILAGIAVPIVIYFFLKRWDYNALQSGEETARSLGVNTWRTRLAGIMLASLLTATCVAFAGIIGFIGLLGPHMMRGIMGSDHRFLIPAASIWGAILLVLSDTLARTVISPVILPVGIITSFMGAPLFLYILIKREDT